MILLFNDNTVRILCFFTLLALAQYAEADKLDDQRNTFLQAEKYLAEKNEAGFAGLSEGLADYPLYPYLRYLAVKEQLPKTDQILSFLTTYQDSRYASLLLSKWLGYLAEQERWAEFLQHYHVDDQSADDCRYHWARYQTGSQEPALIDAKRLWLAGKPSERECRPLFKAFEKSAQLSPEILWQRFEAVIEDNQDGVAQALASLMKNEQKKQAETWLLLHEKPELISEPRFWQDKTELTGKLFAHTVKRLKNKDLEQSIQQWEAKAAAFSMPAEIRSDVERRFGMALLGKKDSRAFSHLDKVVNPDDESRVSKVRAALLEQNWRHVDSALAGLMPEQKNQPQWRYWMARTLAETGKSQQAEAAFKTLAEDRSIYGFMAADKVKMTYNIKDLPVKPDNVEISVLASSADFMAVREFNLLGRPLEVKRQWQFAIKNLSKDKLLFAAKLAEQWGLDQLAITTLVKADYWDDMALRFPIRYLDEVTNNASRHNLDAPLIYGVMRQESMLDKNALSSAGAMGLMQLMPDTAKKVAKDLNESWRSSYDLYKPEVNIHFGAYYFKDLLQRFGSHVAVTSAAYNAGPNRANKWLPAFAPVPGDIWIETIPYKETRKYVSSVLTYAIIYQQRLKKNGLSLKGLLPDVLPAKKLG
jgi:soluble lytic murein transglycosylase